MGGGKRKRREERGERRRNTHIHTHTRHGNIASPFIIKQHTSFAQSKKEEFDDERSRSHIFCLEL
jgi:hypothetical protein|tara:strand:- start:887 stop:1081 length:195 start_codon:yes stop_codon:yes gene_type:complete